MTLLIVVLRGVERRIHRDIDGLAVLVDLLQQLEVVEDP